MEGHRLKQFELPSLGQVSMFVGKTTDAAFAYSFESFLQPSLIFYHDLVEDKRVIFAEPKVHGFDPSSFQVEQVFSTSKDGTAIPAFIIKRKDLEQNGKNPCLMWGYGGFNINILPSFSPIRTVWMQYFHGMYVLVNLRGGEEYGEEWHQGGIKDKKQNVFDDFIATGESLIAKHYTSPNHLAIIGGSNGGLLVGACVNQRPDLFAAAIAQVGVLDMLKYHKFTIGHAWISDYGNPDLIDDFKFIFKYSPLHNVRKGKEYPALMLTTADHDDRVVPAHSFKYISEVQHQLGSEPYQSKPLIIRIDVKAGHGAGKPLLQTLQEYADIYAFVAKYTGATWKS